MIRSILVPLDGSTVAESILPTIVAFARVTGAAVTLFQVVEALGATEGGLDPVLSLLTTQPETERVPDADVEARAAERADAYLVATAQRLSHQGVTVHTRVVVGHPAEEIVQAGAAFDLIAMATHGRSGIGRWVYGSVADKVLHGATVPTLLIRAREEAPAQVDAPHRIVVPLDGSALAEQAIPLAAAVAQQAGAAVTVVYSVAWAAMAMADPAGYGAAMVTADLLTQAEADGRAYLAEVRERLRAQNLSAQAVVRIDPAADAILTVATEQQADVIVMCTHGRSGLGRWVLGSVADRVLRGATIPVLLVRAGMAGVPDPAAQPPA
jgi:nucleotide-binding universal stress UspA family protein